MKLDDIARMAISEVSAELEKIEALQNKKQEELERENLKKELLAMESAKEQVFEEPKVETSVPSAQSEPEPAVQISPKSREISEEEIFLANLAERIEVLFEGLKQTSEQDLNQRLELTTKFLEFTLANIENRLQNLSK